METCVADDWGIADGRGRCSGDINLMTRCSRFEYRVHLFRATRGGPSFQFAVPSFSRLDTLQIVVDLALSEPLQ